MKYTHPLCIFSLFRWVCDVVRKPESAVGVGANYLAIGNGANNSVLVNSDTIIGRSSLRVIYPILSLFLDGLIVIYSGIVDVVFATCGNGKNKGIFITVAYGIITSKLPLTMKRVVYFAQIVFNIFSVAISLVKT